MLILVFIFELWQDPDHQPQPYPLKLHRGGEAHHDYFRVNRTALPKSFGTTAFERCLVLLPGSGIKPVIYCTSIRQRERICFRQINSWPSGLWSRQTALRMLTYHSNPLSNPVNPEMLYIIEIQRFAYYEKKLSCGQYADMNPWLSSSITSLFYAKLVQMLETTK